MEKIYINIVITYALFVAIYFLWVRIRKKQKKNIIGSSNHIKRQLEIDIVGKSKFDLKKAKTFTAKPMPFDANTENPEDQPENPDTFASSKEEGTSAEVPLDELDEAFSDTPPNEENEPMDIDYPLEYETGEENENEPEDEEEETEQIEGMAPVALATGVQFENLGNAVRTVNKTEDATKEQKHKAGETLLDMRKTDMFEQLISSKPDAKKIVNDLMVESLAEFHSRKDMEDGNLGSDRKAPDNFNIKDFA